MILRNYMCMEQKQTHQKGERSSVNYAFLCITRYVLQFAKTTILPDKLFKYTFLADISKVSTTIGVGSTDVTDQSNGEASTTPRPIFNNTGRGFYLHTR